MPSFSPRLVLGLHVLFELREDHPACRGLEHARDHDFHVLVDVPAAVLHDDHGAVVEVGDPLAGLLAFLEHEDAHALTRQGHGLESVGQVVDVQHLYALELGDLVQVEIVGDHFRPEFPGKGHKLAVHFADLGKIVLGDPDIHVPHLLDAVEDIEPPPAPGALQRIRRIGDVLELL